MRVQTDTYNVYKFDELTKEVQDEVLQRERENIDYPFLGEDLQTELEQQLKDNKIKYDEAPKVLYILGYCQGDGAMFEGTIYWKSYTANVKQSGHYYHFNSKSIELYSTKTDKEASDKVYQQFNDMYVDICKELEKTGYEYIEYATSNKAIIEMIDANEWEFTGSGEFV
jgi:hypothetical protein